MHCNLFESYEIFETLSMLFIPCGFRNIVYFHVYLTTHLNAGLFFIKREQTSPKLSTKCVDVFLVQCFILYNPFNLIFFIAKYKVYLTTIRCLEWFLQKTSNTLFGSTSVYMRKLIKRAVCVLIFSTTIYSLQV